MSQTPRVWKIWPAKENILLAEDLNLASVDVADCQVVVKDINQQSMAPYGAILQEIIARKSSMISRHFMYDGRSFNLEAHVLAKHASSLGAGRYIWLDLPYDSAIVPLNIISDNQQSVCLPKNFSSLHRSCEKRCGWLCSRLAQGISTEVEATTSVYGSDVGAPHRRDKESVGTWAIVCLTVAFAWQLYTLRLLVNLHEPVAGGTRYSRYMHLATTVFGERWGKILALLPTMYLSAGTCTALIIVGGGSMKILFSIACGPACLARPPTMVEWYVVFVCVAVVLSQLPNLNSIAGVSLVGATAAVGYCTMIWVISVAKGRVAGVSYDPVKASSDVDRTIAVLNGLGIIAFAFRGHNLVLEIQGTMPSTLKHPSHVPMWKGVKFAYLVVALCLYPVAIGGFWAYGNQIPPNGILSALYKFHSRDVSRLVIGLATLLVIVNCLTTFQIYAMPVFDNMEAGEAEVIEVPTDTFAERMYLSRNSPEPQKHYNANRALCKPTRYDYLSKA
ncbi:hypothetical protein TRIUR3_14050 [Triticum urartu]|uniref:Amino acid transporter transmembrane domain-containing protein n=1 Tax=Triticum urartu TaxID=4572 RepID=M7Z6Z6_TRIUA|nr:hypothetical protein TRIUR3_14050 [Triticum urartu]